MDMVEQVNGHGTRDLVPVPNDENQTTGKRPMNAFLLFCKRHRGLVKERYPNLENRNITKILGEWWQSSSDQEKASFNSLATEFKEHVLREQPNFRWRKQPSSANASHSSISNSLAAMTSVNNHSSRDSFSSSSSHNNPSQLSPVELSSGPSPSHGGSGSSSPEPSPPSNDSSTGSAPKHFKKRFLQAATEQQAKLNSEDSASGPVSPDAEHACKALLQLAGVREASPNGSQSGSRSGTSSPPSDSGSGQGKGDSGNRSANGGSKTEEFKILRDAVWSRVAKTLLKQEAEKGNQSHGDSDDAPLNLSSQCTIRGQQIIEHIIENILDKPLADGERAADTSGVSFNNNTSRTNGDGLASSNQHHETAEEIKERIYMGLKQDFQNRGPGAKDDKKDMTALWNLLPHKMVNQKSQKTSTANPKLTTPTTRSPSPSVTNTTKPTSAVTRNDLATNSSSGLDIKSLLAHSPAPQSPRAKANGSNQLRTSPPPVSVTLITTESRSNGETTNRPLNLSTTPPQTPSVSVTPMSVEVNNYAQQDKTSNVKALKRAHEDDEEDRRRSSRSCKGKRYQELRDEGHLGRKGRKTHRSGDDHSSHADEGGITSLNKSESSSSEIASPIPLNSKDTQRPLRPSGQSFDVMAKLNAIPALSLEVYQQRVKAKSAPVSGATSNGPDHPQRRSGNLRSMASDHQNTPGAQSNFIESPGSRRKGRRSAPAKEDTPEEMAVSS